MHRGRFGDYSAIDRLTVNDVLLESATVGDPSAYGRHISAMRRGCNGDVLTISWRCLDDVIYGVGIEFLLLIRKKERQILLQMIPLPFKLRFIE